MSAGNPATIEKRGHWFKATTGLAVSGIAFGLFFLQTGLDRYRTGTSSVGTVLLLGLEGWLLGTLGVTAWASLVWALSRTCGVSLRWLWVLQSYGWCYGPVLISGVIGLLMSLVLGWNTAMTFGLGAMVMAASALYEFHHKLTGGRALLCIPLTVTGGGLVLWIWERLATR